MVIYMHYTIGTIYGGVVSTAVRLDLIFMLLGSSLVPSSSQALLGFLYITYVPLYRLDRSNYSYIDLVILL